MKKLAIIFAAIVVLVGCATVKETRRVVLTSFSDYRPYAAEGFLISPNPYTYNFESVGEIDIVVEPAMVKELTEGLYYNYETLVYETISYDELVKIAVDEAKAKGADALVNFSIVKEKISHPNKLHGGYTYSTIYYIKGFCIKRR